MSPAGCQVENLGSVKAGAAKLAERLGHGLERAASGLHGGVECLGDNLKMNLEKKLSHPSHHVSLLPSILLPVTTFKRLVRHLPGPPHSVPVAPVIRKMPSCTVPYTASPQ